MWGAIAGKIARIAGLAGCIGKRADTASLASSLQLFMARSGANRARVTGVLASCMLVGVMTVGAAAQAVDADGGEVEWFVGQWAVRPAPAAGFEDLGAGADCQRPVTIVATGPSTIRRIVKGRQREDIARDFTVKRIHGNYPWWSLDGRGGPVAQRKGAHAFVLASTRMGRADFANGLLHERCH